MFCDFVNYRRNTGTSESYIYVNSGVVDNNKNFVDYKMKKIVLLLFALISLISCEKDETSNISGSIYYVKYDVSCQCSGGVFRKAVADISISYTGGSGFTAEGVNSYTWTTTKGPFKKGDYVSLSVGTKNIRATSVTINSSISVSKDDGPFVPKSTKSGVGSCGFKIE